MIISSHWKTLKVWCIDLILEIDILPSKQLYKTWSIIKSKGNFEKWRSWQFQGVKRKSALFKCSPFIFYYKLCLNSIMLEFKICPVSSSIHDQTQLEDYLDVLAKLQQIQYDMMFLLWTWYVVSDQFHFNFHERFLSG